MDPDPEPWYAPGPCPQCGKRVEVDFDCPGWGNPVKVCFPCGNATLYECEDRDGCGWAYRTPNRRDDAKGPPPTAWAAKDLTVWGEKD